MDQVDWYVEGIVERPQGHDIVGGDKNSLGILAGWEFLRGRRCCIEHWTFFGILRECLV